MKTVFYKEAKLVHQLNLERTYVWYTVQLILSLSKKLVSKITVFVYEAHEDNIP